MQDDTGNSWNNTLASPVYETENNLGEIVHFIVK